MLRKTKLKNKLLKRKNTQLIMLDFPSWKIDSFGRSITIGKVFVVIRKAGRKHDEFGQYWILYLDGILYVECEKYINYNFEVLA